MCATALSFFHAGISGIISSAMAGTSDEPQEHLDRVAAAVRRDRRFSRARKSAGSGACVSSTMNGAS